MRVAQTAGLAELMGLRGTCLAPHLGMLRKHSLAVVIHPEKTHQNGSRSPAWALVHLPRGEGRTWQKEPKLPRPLCFVDQAKGKAESFAKSALKEVRGPNGAAWVPEHHLYIQGINCREGSSQALSLQREKACWLCNIAQASLAPGARVWFCSWLLFLAAPCSRFPVGSGRRAWNRGSPRGGPRGSLPGRAAGGLGGFRLPSESGSEGRWQYRAASPVALLTSPSRSLAAFSAPAPAPAFAPAVPGASARPPSSLLAAACMPAAAAPFARSCARP